MPTASSPLRTNPGSAQKSSMCPAADPSGAHHRIAAGVRVIIGRGAAYTARIRNQAET